MAGLWVKLCLSVPCLSLLSSSSMTVCICTPSLDLSVSVPVCLSLSVYAQSLHWLPVAFRIDFKVNLFVFKALNGLAPQYISDLLSPHIPSRHLRSADKALLVPPKTKLVTEGDRAFAARAPLLWNQLPLEIRQSTSVSTFKRLLKTYYYKKAFLNS